MVAFTVIGCSDEQATIHISKQQRELTMEYKSIGRLDFNLAEVFAFKGRYQSIYYVDAETIPLAGQAAEDLWKQHINKLQDKLSSEGISLNSLKAFEINPGFNVVFYNTDPESPNSVNIESYKAESDHVLYLKFAGVVSKKENMLRLITLTAGDYHAAIPNGFNVGAGSLIGPPGVNETASISFYDAGRQFSVDIETQTPGPALEENPMSDVQGKIDKLKKDGVEMKSLVQGMRNVAGFSGHESLTSIKKSGQEHASFTYIWFFPGETAKAFRPQIYIKFSGSTSRQQEADIVWSELLNSIRLRDK